MDEWKIDVNQQILLVKYHPAKKEIAFSRSISGKEIEITGSDGSILSEYINKKGQFVLQDHGKKFFNDIIDAFDGEDVVLEVITTKEDFEDFRQMIEYFNKTSEIKITASLIAELPDMNTAYEAIKNHGLKSIEILKKSKSGFSDVDSKNENVLACIDIFSKEIEDASDGILQKINTLETSSVNVCFSGPYSSGKSLIINSLIGYAILPTDIRPETAAMFMIRSPQPNENIRINFNIIDSDSSFAEVMWNEKDNRFVFVAGPSESKTRKAIQETMNECRDKMLYEQVHSILECLNANDNVERVINVYFPIALDNDKVQFTFYDTPGTDSGVLAHSNILKDALSEQTHSILIFVTHPNGLDGGGNKLLLEYLSEIDNSEDLSTIDLGRSLFVINYADSLTEDEEFEAIRLGSISNKNDNDNATKESEDERKPITIKLSDKKVFFTSAKYAYPAVAAKNGASTKRDQKLLNSGKTRDILEDDGGKYYRQDRCASSDYATQKLIEKCDNEFARAEKANDKPGMIWVASGLFALQTEILEYGKKYAAAVKAYSIIDGVEKALNKLSRNAAAIEKQNSDDIQNVEKEISTIKTAITKGILKAKEGRELGENDPLPEKVSKLLRLDADSITTFVQDPVDSRVNNTLLNWLQKVVKDVFGNIPKETRWDEGKGNIIEGIIRDVLSDYTNNFINNRKALLEGLRDAFIKDVKASIMNNGEISEEAKQYIIDIETPEIDEFDESTEFDELYRQSKTTKKWLWIEHEVIDHELFISEMNKKLRTIAGELADSYKKNYRNSLNSLLQKVENEFITNMDKYSVSLKAKLEDKGAMERLKEKILETAGQLSACQKQLNSVIWEAKK